MFRKLSAFLLVSAIAAPTWATEGVIVQRDGDEVVVDLGSDDGLVDGVAVIVYRRLEVVHPVTKKKIEDRFPIGAMQLDEVGSKLSIATAWSDLERAPKPGDFVVFEPAPPPRPVTKRSEDAAAASSPIDMAFHQTLGRSLTDRVAIWQQFLRRQPESPWTEEVKRELRWLRQRLDARTPDAVVEPPPPPEPTVDAIVAAPSAVERGMPIRFDVAAQHPERVEKIRLNVRRRGDPTYDVVELEPTGDYNWSAELDGDRWRDAEQVEMFAETIRKDGQLERARPAATPIVDVVAPAPDPLGQANRSRAKLVADLVDFKAGAGQDEYSRVEASYRYAVDTWVLDGFSVGVGMFRGAGASLADIQAGEPSRISLLGYGFAALDFGLDEIFGINTRILVGNNQQLGVPDSVFQDAFGLGGELRFGKTDSTKLLLGMAFTETIGAEAWITLDIDALERVPMSGEVVVTNLPVGEDLGVSLNYGAGYAFTDWFSLLGRVGWNARTISHHGPTAGVSTVFEW